MNETAATTISELVTQHMPSWSNGEPNMTTHPDAHVDEVWLKPGTEQAYDAIMKEFLAFVAEMGYPYPVQGYRHRLGGTGEHYIVTFFDNRANFYGANKLDRLIEKKGATERWQGLLTRFSTLITRAHHYDSDYRANMSYVPPPQASDAGAN